ncbi:hypothetical protein PR048_016313 [Dryococelus australis]|uniref:DDE Tnp4 domain-containing protein n=1 Tax=Dryococelus australis TaxID=614101 RepID=A0ABQ9HJE3_9NEOP|nr:hypothetical protein PR048_016313 [Dryococelus australis]
MLPPGSGSYVYNYKNFHSQVLLGKAKANYELLYFSFGINGRVSDGSVFEASHLSTKLEDGSLNLKKEGTIAGKNMRYVLVVDDAFPLREYVVNPFSRKIATPARKIFNYRVFGIIVEKFGYTTLLWRVAPFTISCVQRNRISLDEEEFESGNVTSGPCCKESMRLRKTARHPNKSAEQVRESFVEYLNS